MHFLKPFLKRHMRNLGQVVLFVAFRHVWTGATIHPTVYTSSSLLSSDKKDNNSWHWRMLKNLQVPYILLFTESSQDRLTDCGHSRWAAWTAHGTCRCRRCPSWTPVHHPAPPITSPTSASGNRIVPGALTKISWFLWLAFSHLTLCPQQVLPALFEMDPEPFHTPYLHCYYLRLKHGLPSLFLLCLQAYSFFPQLHQEACGI